jgi:hypothetical protein
VQAREEFLLRLKDVLVIRIVVSAEEQGTNLRHATWTMVTHGREGATYKEDLLLVIRGKSSVEGVFGKEFAEFVKTLKLTPGGVKS